jgi:hypothetical protein
MAQTVGRSLRAELWNERANGLSEARNSSRRDLAHKFLKSAVRHLDRIEVGPVLWNIANCRPRGSQRLSADDPDGHVEPSGVSSRADRCLVDEHQLSGIKHTLLSHPPSTRPWHICPLPFGSLRAFFEHNVVSIEKAPKRAATGSDPSASNLRLRCSFLLANSAPTSAPNSCSSRNVRPPHVGTPRQE